MTELPIDAIQNRTLRIAVIGLGYVGLPLAVAFGEKYRTVGFDLKKQRIESLMHGYDYTGEVTSAELAASKFLRFTNDSADIKNSDVFIVTVPTPVDKANCPDISLLLVASETVGNAIRPGGIVIYESTVYPGCTEEDCIPVVVEKSGLVFNRDFFAGYSPERVNPGECEKIHKLKEITKVVSGSTVAATAFVNELYQSILHCKPHIAPSIKVAEAAKVIENTQRDLNIAFVNELAKICKMLGIDTHDVLDAAGTKWNFLKFQPGLVGGHCIGVDPYYLTHKAITLGYKPEVILAGRRINDGMGRYVASEIIKCMIRKNVPVLNARVLQLGITFKENCPDIRNSRAVDVVRALEEFGCNVTVCDPLAQSEDVLREYGIDNFYSLPDIPVKENFDVIVLAVAHKAFQSFPYQHFAEKNCIIYDIKGVVPREWVDERL